MGFWTVYLYDGAEAGTWLGSSTAQCSALQSCVCGEKGVRLALKTQVGPCDYKRVWCLAALAAPARRAAAGEGRRGRSVLQEAVASATRWRRRRTRARAAVEAERRLHGAGVGRAGPRHAVAARVDRRRDLAEIRGQCCVILTRY
jgi:hypothetical protein